MEIKKEKLTLTSRMYDLTGQKFNKLKVIEFAEIRLSGKTKIKKSFWKCICECGNTKIVCGADLKSGHTKSCGCLKNEHILSLPRKIHGMYNTNFYSVWGEMKTRCNNNKHKSYKNYGGRGIKVSKEWHTFENFRDDMYSIYLKHIEDFGRKNTSIERLNNDGNYCKSNCTFATRAEQNKNKRNIIVI